MIWTLVKDKDKDKGIFWISCTNHDTDQTYRHCQWVRPGAILHSERPDTLDQVDILSRPGKVTVFPTNTIFMDKGTNKGEAHCPNIYPNGSLDIFSWNFLLQIFFCISVLTDKYVFGLRTFLLLHKLKKWRQPYLCQLITEVAPISTLEPNQIILYNLNQEEVRVCSWKQMP